MSSKIARHLSPQARRARIEAIIESDGDLNRAAASLDMPVKVLRGWTKYGPGFAQLPPNLQERLRPRRNGSSSPKGVPLSDLTKLFTPSPETVPLETALLDGYLKLAALLLKR